MRKESPGRRSAIVFLHGFALDGRMWEAQVTAFSGTNEVLSPDLPGFGSRLAGTGDETLARSVARLCDGRRITDVHLVGGSLGGAVAVDFALAFPERVRSLTLADPLLRGRPVGIAASSRCAGLAKEGRMRDAHDAWLADPLFDGARRRPEVFAKLREIVRDYRGAHWMDQAATRFEVEDPALRLHEINIPALVLVGGDDLPTFRAMADEYAAKLPRARKVVLEGVGHLGNMESAELFNATLARFLEAPPPA